MSDYDTLWAELYAEQNKTIERINDSGLAPYELLGLTLMLASYWFGCASAAYEVHTGKTVNKTELMEAVVKMLVNKEKQRN